MGDHELILRYISTLGFPICVAIAFGWALWKIGNELLATHKQFVADIKANAVQNTVLVGEIKQQGQQIVTELARQTEILESPSTLFADVCRAEEKKRRSQP